MNLECKIVARTSRKCWRLYRLECFHRGGGVELEVIGEIILEHFADRDRHWINSSNAGLVDIHIDDFFDAKSVRAEILVESRRCEAAALFVIVLHEAHEPKVRALAEETLALHAQLVAWLHVVLSVADLYEPCQQLVWLVAF